MMLLASCAKDEDQPEVDDRDKFTGSWICTENNTSSFTINISKTSAENTIKISNFSNFGTTEPQCLALISGNSMSIPSQDITLTSIHIQGSAIMNSANNKITMDYVADGDTIKATCVR